MDESMKNAVDFDNFRLGPQLDKHAQATLLREPSATRQHALSNSTAKGLPPINVLPLAAEHLSILTKLMNVKTVLEVGTLGGYSSICFAEAGATVTSVEIDPKHHAVAVENVAPLGPGKVEVLLGKSDDVLPKLAAEGRQFDLVFIDADMVGQWEQFDWAVKLTRPGGCVFLDDVVVAMMKDGFGRGLDEQETVLTRIGRDDRVQATLVPVVANHPMVPTPVFNGYVIAFVKGH